MNYCFVIQIKIKCVSKDLTDKKSTTVLSMASPPRRQALANDVCLDMTTDMFF